MSEVIHTIRYLRDEVGLPANELDHAMDVAEYFNDRNHAHRLTVALLHDTIEDGYLTAETIEKRYGKGIARDVQTVSRGDDETYAQYLIRVREKGTDAAIAVKLADLRVNLARCKADPESEKAKRLTSRYERALKFLTYRSEEF